MVHVRMFSSISSSTNEGLVSGIEIKFALRTCLDDGYDGADDLVGFIPTLRILGMV